MNMQETFSTRAAGTSPSGYVVLRPQLPKFKTFMVVSDRLRKQRLGSLHHRMDHRIGLLNGGSDPGPSGHSCISTVKLSEIA